MLLSGRLCVHHPTASTHVARLASTLARSPPSAGTSPPPPPPAAGTASTACRPPRAHCASGSHAARWRRRPASPGGMDGWRRGRARAHACVKGWVLCVQACKRVCAHQLAHAAPSTTPPTKPAPPCCCCTRTQAPPHLVLDEQRLQRGGAVVDVEGRDVRQEVVTWKCSQEQRWGRRDGWLAAVAIMNVLGCAQQAAASCRPLWPAVQLLPTAHPRGRCRTQRRPATAGEAGRGRCVWAWARAGQRARCTERVLSIQHLSFIHALGWQRREPPAQAAAPRSTHQDSFKVITAATLAAAGRQVHLRPLCSPCSGSGSPGRFRRRCGLGSGALLCFGTALGCLWVHLLCLSGNQVHLLGTATDAAPAVQAAACAARAAAARARVRAAASRGARTSRRPRLAAQLRRLRRCGLCRQRGRFLSG